jgi:uncharacterized protein YkwD
MMWSPRHASGGQALAWPRTALDASAGPSYAGDTPACDGPDGAGPGYGGGCVPIARRPHRGMSLAPPRAGVSAGCHLLCVERGLSVNYFAALLLMAGLPTTVGSSVGALPAAVTVMPAVPATGSPTASPAVVYVPIDALAVSLTSSSASLTVSASPPTGTTPARGSAVGSGGSSAGSSQTASGSNTPMAMIDLINQARMADGLAPYAINATLMTLAQERAEALATGPFTSDLPTYGWPAQMEEAAGIQASGLGAENIAEAGSVSQAFALLMASAPHRANILNPYETQVGVGVAPWGSGVAISELFIGPNT